MDLELFKTVVPLLAVLLTAALSGYIVPRITRRWQDHQKELDIKTSLVAEISDAVSQILLAMQLSERGATEQKVFDEAYRQWEIRRSILTAKLRAYFRKRDVAGAFQKLSDAITEFYALGGTSSYPHRSKQIEKLKSYFGNDATDWDKLADLEQRKTNFFDWFFSWWALREAALKRKDDIIRELLETPIGFLRG